MNCEQCDRWVQDALDGVEPDSVLVDHLVSCPACRDLYESAVGLRRAMADLPRPRPSEGLTDLIVSAVLIDRRRRRKRRDLYARAAALAACLLVAVFIVSRRPAERPPTETPIAVKPSEVPPSLRKTVVQAGGEVVDRARRRVGDAVSGTLQLIPPVDTAGLNPMDDFPLEPTVRPLRDAGQGVGSGLEPVADSARRAFALFVRDLSPGGRGIKPGS